MNPGARFLKCDLHMHTPADVSNWRGPRMGHTEEEQQAAADEYIRRCYDEGLELVAVTDHNFLSMRFLPLLRKAAERLALTSDYKLTILPGFEIQADVGKGMHVICIFDPDADLMQIDHILTECGIAAERRSSTGALLSSTKRLPEIIDVVQKTAVGRSKGVITCPHCQAESGIFDNDRISDWLQAQEFTNPDLLCVEVPKPIDAMKQSWQHLLRSDLQCVPQYRRARSVACIMSSDAKALVKDQAENYIGFRCCWIKVADRSVEGLRQAFLAHQSRVRLTRPSIPGQYVRHVEVGACKFFRERPLHLPLNPQFNALIGGRGTGKSTLLEYVRWCLCDQPLLNEAADPQTMESPLYAARRKSLIEGTLKNQEASLAYVRVELELNGTAHLITRYADSDRLTLQIGNGAIQEVTETDVRRLLPIQAYSQKQLSTVAGRIEELRRLVEAPIQAQLLHLDERITSARASLRRYYEALWRAKELEGQVRAHEAELCSLAEQGKSLKGQIANVSPEDETILNAHSGYGFEQQVIDRVEADVAAMRTALTEAQRRLDALPRDSAISLVSPQREIVGRAVLLALRARAVASEALERATELVTACEPQLSVEKTAWRKALGAHELAYAAAAQRAVAFRTQIEQMRRISDRAAVVQHGLDAVRAERAAIVIDPSDETGKVNAWMQLHKDRADLLDDACAKLTRLSQGDIRVVLKRGGDAEAAFRLLKEKTAGAGIRTEWLERLKDVVVSAQNPASEWTALLNERRALAEVPSDQAETAEMPECPQLGKAGFTAAAFRKSAARFQPNDWLELTLTSLNDRPEYYYVFGEGNEIRFEEASPGQQATALLTVLLNQEGGPLVIDQPEDDLDNAIISRVVETIWSAKEHRQLIFSSHNANLVVNGDAELVIQCDYIAEGNRSTGHIACMGSIDQQAVCQAIKSVMEGGELAFELRKAKYGL